MECLWSLFGNWQQDGYRYQQDPPVFHVCLTAYNGLSYYHLHGTCFLEKYAEIHVGS